MSSKNLSVNNISKLAWLYPVIFGVVTLLFWMLVVVELPGFLESIIYFIPYISFSLSVHFFLKLKKRNVKKIKKINEIRLIVSILIISVISLFFQYNSLAKEYGGLDQIISSAYMIRQELIGQSTSIFPWWIGYAFSVSYFGFAFVLLTNNFNSWKKNCILILLFILIFIYDLTTFGRVGTIFSIFLLISHAILTQGILKIIKVKYIIMMFLLFLISSVARLIRGSFDNFEGSMDFEFKNINDFGLFNGLIIAMKYYTESFFAFSKIINTEFDFELGGRNFLVINNFISKFTGGSYKNRIDEMTAIPFDANIYGIQWDMYLDFGIVGVVIIPFVWAGLTIYLLKSDSKFDQSAGILLIAGYFFWPIFNIFTFGGMFIALAMAVLFGIMEKSRI